jgi:hypothetical protein
MARTVGDEMQHQQAQIAMLKQPTQPTARAASVRTGASRRIPIVLSISAFLSGPSGDQE